MRIRTDPDQPCRARDDYLRRYRRRGDRTRPVTRASDTIPDVAQALDHAYGSRPNHRARAVPLPFIIAGPQQRPVQKPCPATRPLTGYDLEKNYARQALIVGQGLRRMTPRQQRRLTKKRRAVGAGR